MQLDLTPLSLGIVYHALNRGNGRNELFHKPEDYSAFERIMTEAMQRCPIRLLAYCLMPNHWHTSSGQGRKGR